MAEHSRSPAIASPAAIANAFSAAADRRMRYAWFSGAVLEANGFVRKLTALRDQGILAGSADLDALCALVPDLMSLEARLAGSSHDRRVAASGTWVYSP